MSNKQETKKREDGKEMERRETKRGMRETVRYSLPILLAALVRVERTTFRTRLGVAELGVLTLTLVLLGLLDLRTIASSTSEPPAASTVKTTSGIGLLNSTKATLRTLSNPDVLSSANSAHVFTGTTI